MSRHRKYPQTTGWYVYKHIFPNDMYYPGISSQQPCDRWNPSQYNTTSARVYIEYFGWENVVHVIVADGLTKEEAEKLENQLIQEGKKNGLCINKNNSGGYSRDNKKEWQREYDQRPEVMERRREHYQSEEYKEWKREYDRQRYQKKKALQQ